MCNLQSDGKRNSLGKAQLDKLLSVLLFVLRQKALHLYSQGLPPLWSHLSPWHCRTEGFSCVASSMHELCARVASMLTRGLFLSGSPTDCEHCGFKASFPICPGSAGCAAGANTHAQSDSWDSSIQSPVPLLYRAGLATSCLVFRESFPREGCREKEQTDRRRRLSAEQGRKHSCLHHLNMWQCTLCPAPLCLQP